MGEEILGEDRASALLSQPPLWDGRSSWIQLLILRIPVAILLLLFVGAFGWALIESARHGFATYSRYAQTRPPSAAHVLTPLEIVAGSLLLGGLALFIFLRPLLADRRRRFVFTREGLIVRDGKRVVLWRYADLSRTSFGPLAGGYQVDFGLHDGELPELHLSRTQARRLAESLRDTMLAIDETAIRHVPSSPAGLLPGERILWQGRRGLGSVSMMRRIGLGALAFPVIGYGVVVWQIIGYSDSIMGRIMGLLLTFMAGGMAVVAAVIALSSLLRDCLFDVLGRMIVTDRRIVWTAPITGRLYREVSGERILDVDLIENSGRSGWLALRIGRADDWTQMDLHGVPRATEAEGAIRRIIA